MRREKNLKILSNPRPKYFFRLSAVHLTTTQTNVKFVNILISALPSRFLEISKKRHDKTNPYRVFRGTPHFGEIRGTPPPRTSPLLSELAIGNFCL